MRRPPLTVIAAGLLIAAGLVLTLLVPSGRGPRAGPHRALAGRAVDAARGPAPLRLEKGSGLVNGVLTEYPRSQAGAVSAAVEFVTELGSTLEPDRAATVARLTASPSFPAAPQDAAAGAVAARCRLGLPAAGPLPPGTSVSVVPVQYQLRDVRSSELTVLLLFDYTQITATAIQNRLGVTAVRLGWTPASWRLLAPAGPGPSGLLATPGTAGATAKGWREMTDVL
jgi:hypothetical protein